MTKNLDDFIYVVILPNFWQALAQTTAPTTYINGRPTYGELFSSSTRLIYSALD
jgi:hypothetical protein